MESVIFGQCCDRQAFGGSGGFIGGSGCGSGVLP